MRTILYILILVIMLFAPVARIDIAKLSPVEAVAVYKENGLTVLKTDVGDEGRGSNGIEALENLKMKASSIIYLDTARYLLVGEGANEAAASLQKHLKPGIRLGEYKGGDVKEEAKYLDVHADSAKPTG